MLSNRVGLRVVDTVHKIKQIKILQIKGVNYIQQKRGFRSLSPAKVGGGRSSVSGIIATVFGATGYVGRYVVNNLGRTGSQVIIPFRGDEHDYRHLKVMGDIGTIVPFRFDIRDVESVKTAISRSNVVINLIGNTYETRYYSHEDINVKVPKMLAYLCAEAGVERFIHFSCLGADVNSKFKFQKTKAEGEKAVLEVFPNATIFKPAPIFGHFDYFLNTIAVAAKKAFVPILNEGKSRIQPIYALDVANAVMNAIMNDTTMGKTYCLGGKKVFSMMEIVDMVYKSIQRDNITVHFKYPGIVSSLTWPLFKNVFDLMKMDYVVPHSSLTIEDLHVEKIQNLEDIVGVFVRHYRPGLEY